MFPVRIQVNWRSLLINLGGAFVVGAVLRYLYIVLTMVLVLAIAAPRGYADAVPAPKQERRLAQINCDGVLLTLTCWSIAGAIGNCFVMAWMEAGSCVDKFYERWCRTHRAVVEQEKREWAELQEQTGIEGPPRLTQIPAYCEGRG